MNLTSEERQTLVDVCGVRKFRQFILADYKKIQESSVLSEVERIEKDTTIEKTEREAIVKARIGQGLFRNRLIEHWHGCSITRFGMCDCLVASHIKPWKDSTNEERLSVYNGLLLLPNYDKFFDKGYISFDIRGKIIYSRFFPLSERKLLGMDDSIHLLKVDERHKSFLQYHNEYCLIQ